MCPHDTPFCDYKNPMTDNNDLPEPWSRRLEETASHAYLAGLERGFKAGVCMTMAAFVFIAAAGWLFSKITIGF